MPGSTAEATKTEPDKNTYLVLDGQTGADPGASYGRHFLYQGHEDGTGYLTRINLDANQAHRVTLLASTDVNGQALPTFDGSTYDPFAKKLLFTAEHGNSADGGVWSGRPPSTCRPRSATSVERLVEAATRASRTTPPATCGSSRTSAVPMAPVF